LVAERELGDGSVWLAAIKQCLAPECICAGDGSLPVYGASKPIIRSAMLALNFRDTGAGYEAVVTVSRCRGDVFLGIGNLAQPCFCIGRERNRLCGQE